MRSLLPFLAALGLSVALLLAGALLDGWVDFASLIWMAAVVAVLDHVLPAHGAEGPDARQAAALSTALAAIHFPLLGAAVWALAEGGPMANWLAYFAATGLYFGQIGNACAHELIHARGRLRRGLGRWIYVTLLFGHQTTAHPGIHHLHVATPEDPNTARYDESWWRFCFRAWHHSFWKGFALERRRLTSRGRHSLHWSNPYHLYVWGGLACMGAASIIHGGPGVAAYVALCLLAQAQLLVTDYVLHYGMRRRKVGDRYEPVGPQHSWNAPHDVTNLLTLHAPRHSDHHAHPSRGFEALRVDGDMPRLPFSLPVMVTLALWPRFWRRLMNPRVDALRQGVDEAAAAPQIAA